MKYNLIQRYLFDQLSEEEMKLFLALRESDSLFREEVEYQENLKEVCKIEDDLKFKVLISSFEDELKSKTKNTYLKRTLWLKMTAAAVVVVSLGYFTLMFLSPKQSPEELFAAHFELSKNVSYPITRTSSKQEVLTDAFVAYENQNYKKALTLFETYFEQSKDTTILFYEANVLMASKENIKAIDLLTTVQNSSSTISPRVHWYKALSYLRLNRKKEALFELEFSLKNSDDFKKAETLKLLKSLK